MSFLEKEVEKKQWNFWFHNIWTCSPQIPYCHVHFEIGQKLSVVQKLFMKTLKWKLHFPWRYFKAQKQDNE